jgi:hypothetical protein
MPKKRSDFVWASWEEDLLREAKDRYEAEALTPRLNNRTPKAAVDRFYEVRKRDRKALSPSKMLEIDYTNYRGERTTRRVLPHGTMRFGTSAFHTTPQWLIPMFDVSKGEDREFALKDIHSAKPVQP